MSTYESEIDAVLDTQAHTTILVPADDQHHLIPMPEPRCCSGVPYRTITPAAWKRAAGIPPGKELKDLARARAIEWWPAQAFARAKDHDRAKAALIGWAGITRERAGK